MKDGILMTERNNEEELSSIEGQLQDPAIGPFLEFQKQLFRLISEKNWKTYVVVQLKPSDIWIRTLKPRCSYLSPDVLAHVTKQQCGELDINVLLKAVERKIAKYVTDHTASQLPGSDIC